MPAKKKPARPPKGPNPYLPTLLKLHERWSAEQVASVLTQVDRGLSVLWGGDEYGLSKEIVLRLSQMPQVEAPVVRVGALHPYEGIVGGMPDSINPDGVMTLGKCAKCHVREAVLMVAIGDKVEKVCAECAPKAVPREEEKDGEEPAGA